MSVQAQEESPVTWDIEGWVKSALRNWASGDEDVAITSWQNEITIWFRGRKIASVLVRT